MTAPGLIGQTIGGYAVEALLGSGGMAQVYRGLDLQLQRPVAIKVLAGRAAALPGFAERFRQEARMAANLRHPNIVQIYAFGEERGLPYMVQELLPGPTLEERLDEARRQGVTLAADEVTAVVAQLAAALDAAHAAGIIHRDVKPANALWNAAGALVLTDFGIAKDLGGALNQTQEGVVMGTPAYLAPEQAQGMPLTPATDIYALGVILYELLTGRVPFDAPDSLAVLLQHVQSPPPPPRALRPALPPAVEAVVLRALAKEPAARYPGAGALAQALRQAWPGQAPAGAIHQVATQRWSPPHAQPAPPAQSGPTTVWPAQAPAPGAEAWSRAPGAWPPANLPIPAPASQRRPPLLAALGGLLALAFLCAALLALRGGQGGAGEGQAPAATAGPLAPPADLAAEGPIGAVRELLAAGAADGSAGPQGEALLSTLDAAQQALDQGDAAAATAQLATLQRALLQEARAGTLAPDLLRRALAGIDAAADEHRLALPLSVE